MKKFLNLYPGVGGNRRLLKFVEVTAVEIDPKIAKVYQEFFPNDKVIIGDAHEYLLNHFREFDFIWSSPPCQTHSKMARATRHNKVKYRDYRLYEEIDFLMEFAKCKWVVENVIPFYPPKTVPTKQLGRHLFWSNFVITDFDVPAQPKNFINKTNVAGSEELKEWLGLNYKGNIYYENNHCPSQILRNCVHPELGNHIFKCAEIN